MNNITSKMNYEKELADAVEALYPKNDALQNKVVKNIVNRAYGLNREAILPFLPALVHEWTPAVEAAKYVPQVSVLTTLAAHAITPPGAGGCTVVLEYQAPGAGSEVIATLTIPSGRESSEVSYSHSLSAGSWLFAYVDTANGASGVSIVAVRRLV